ncbi:MAG: hypothetical protein Q7T82_05525 [Armatimonadota bacterium]|nr:hypothetical protein [Armatimonadota bacterium]
MFGLIKSLLFVCLILCLLPGVVFGANQVGWSYSLTDHGGGIYTYDFLFSNLGLAKDAVFKIRIDGQAVPQEWATVSWATPTGWTGQRADGYLDWSTGNGDISNDGYYRLYGQPGAPSPTMGWTSQAFGWTFDVNGGPTPTASYFPAEDAVIHVQQIGDDWHNVGLSYTTNPVPIPEPGGLLTLMCGLGGLVGFVRRGRK